MADVTELRMNVAALKRVDPYVKDILETATHVALYTFNADDNEWEKTDVEGALFVYSRNGEPYHSILIMNRLNTNNLVEPVIQGLDLQLQEPFLLYRNSSCRIFGVWFYDKEECIRIAAVLDKLVKESEMSKKFPEKVALKNKCSASGTNVDIFTMLSRAQEDYNSSKNQANIKRAPAEESKPEMPQGVMDFFAKASSGASHFSSDKVSQPAGIYVGHHQSRAKVTELPCDASDAQLKPLLQHLIPNPVHTVEQIEKQQRSGTPQTDAVSAKRSKGKPLTSKDNNKQNSSGNLKSRSLSSGGVTDGIKAQHGSVFVTQSSSSTSLGLVENGMSFLRIASPTTTCPKLTPYFGTGFQTVSSSGMVMDVITPDQRPLSAPLCSGTDAPQRPALMPPTMFTSSVKNTSDKLEAGNTTVQVHNSDVASVKPRSELPVSTLGTCTSGGVLLDGSVTPVRPEPLTRNQLLQAFNYLLKNDPEFVNKLHEAYVKSFAEMVM